MPPSSLLTLLIVVKGIFYLRHIVALCLDSIRLLSTESKMHAGALACKAAVCNCILPPLLWLYQSNLRMADPLMG